MRIDYDGRRFAPAGPDAEPAEGHYHQDGDLLWAEFSGVNVRTGRLVGTCHPDGTIDAAYCLVSKDGVSVAGACVSSPTLLPDGRIRLVEHWQRLDGSTGVSYVEEVPP